MVKPTAKQKIGATPTKHGGGRHIMKIRPLHDRILVERLEEQEVKRGGIIIPDTAKEKPQEARSEEHTSELQSRGHLVCRFLLEKKKITKTHVPGYGAG